MPRRRAASRVWLGEEPPDRTRSAGGRERRGEQRERNRREGRRRGEREGGGRRGSLSSRPRAGPGSTLPSPLCSSPRRQGAKALGDMRPSRVRLLGGLQDAQLNLNYTSTVTSYSISMVHEIFGV